MLLEHCYMHGKVAKIVGFYLKWLAKRSLDPVFWWLSRAQLRKLLQAYPGNDPASILAVSEHYLGYGYYKRLRPFQVPTEYKQLLDLLGVFNRTSSSRSALRMAGLW